jgi:putative ABC transport system permease protein
MFKIYLKITIRNLLKYKAYSSINIVGLAIGMACCILIFFFVQNELRYDRFHKNAAQIYRVGLKGIIGTEEFNVANAPAPLAETLVREFPEVLHATRVVRAGEIYIRYQDKRFKEENFRYVDSTFFDVFTVEGIRGDIKSALKLPNSVILTPSTAQKYFGTEDPLGKTIIMEDGTEYQVSGIAKEFPQNSHFHFDFLGSLTSLEVSRDQFWIANKAHTYIVLQKDYPPDQLEAKFPDMVRKYVGPLVQNLMGIAYDDFVSSGNSFGFFLQPLLDIHLHSNLGAELEPNNDIKTIYIFSAIGFIILLIACINFINLATARSTRRANEVGVRKVLGSNRFQLMLQFLGESVVFSLIAIFMAIALMELLLPFFNELAGKNLEIRFLDNWFLLPGLIGVALFVGILAGSYPAILLASFQPVSVLKDKFHSGLKGGRIRNGMVVFQFAASIILLVSTLVVYGQLQYIRNERLGFNKEHVLVIPNAGVLGEQQQAFKNELTQNSDIVNVSYSSSLPGRSLSATFFKSENSAEGENHALLYFMADYDFLNTFHLELTEGRYFSRGNSTDSMAVLINAAAVKSLNLTDAVGKPLFLPGDTPEENYTLNIIGVLKDFHMQSLHEKIRPLVVALIEASDVKYVSLKIKPENIQETLNFLESKWLDFVEERPFEYFFLDDDFDRMYRSEIRTAKIFSTFAILAIFVACLGLLGLASFTVERRTKEIGIRKVHGASVAGILFLLSKEFAKWVLLANLIAWPIAWFSMNSWLENFAYRIGIGWWMFVLAGGLALVIALITVSYQAVKAAVMNPVDALRYE